MLKNNEYIGTIIKGDSVISKSNKKVIFKANDKIYIKKVKERNKIRRKKYVLSENLNISCNDLNSDYVYIDSDNQPYFNKILLVLIVTGMFLGIFIAGFTSMFYIQYFVPSVVYLCFLFAALMIYLFYVVSIQPKKLYKRCTETTYGDIVGYIRTEYRHDRNKTFHCKYNIMYKYETSDGNIIHSVVNSYDAKLLYEEYPCNKKVLIRYNPKKCCESCLMDEYNSIFSNEKFVKNSSITVMDIATITNIVTVCIDEQVDEYLKDYYTVDYVECEYYISDKKYKTYSIFSVPHNRFKIGEIIRIFYDRNSHEKFFCDINKEYSKLDTIDF